MFFKVLFLSTVVMVSLSLTFANRCRYEVGRLRKTVTQCNRAPEEDIDLLPTVSLIN